MYVYIYIYIEIERERVSSLKGRSFRPNRTLWSRPQKSVLEFGVREVGGSVVLGKLRASGIQEPGFKVWDVGWVTVGSGICAFYV